MDSCNDENPHAKVREHLQVVAKECSKPFPLRIGAQWCKRFTYDGQSAPLRVKLTKKK